MARKRRPSTSQGQLLLMLEEADAETLACVVASIEPRSVHTFEAEVMALRRLGLIELYRDLGRRGLRYVPLSDAEVEALRPFAELLVSERDPARFDGIMLTEAGRVAVRE